MMEIHVIKALEFCLGMNLNISNEFIFSDVYRIIVRWNCPVTSGDAVQWLSSNVRWYGPVTPGETVQ